MDDLVLEISDRAPDGAVSRILAGLDAAVPGDVGAHVSEAFTLVLKTRDNRIEGGVVAETVWGWLYVKLFWVAEARRGKGLGKRLLSATEREGRRRACHAVWLNTFSFQAPAFYERQGYRRFGHLDDYPRGHRRYFYWKPLDGAAP